MIPPYEDNEWQVVVRRTIPGIEVIQISVPDGEEWKDYWVPNDPENSDFIQYQEWLAEGNEPRIVV